MATIDVRQVCSPADTIRNCNLKTVVQQFLMCNKFCMGRFRPVESVLRRRLGGCHRTETGCRCDWRTFDLEDMQQPGGHRGGSWQLRSGAMPIARRKTHPERWYGRSKNWQGNDLRWLRTISSLCRPTPTLTKIERKPYDGGLAEHGSGQRRSSNANDTMKACI